MGQLTFYFDRNIGKRLPEALTHLRAPFDVRWHNEQKFRHDMPDDEWMEIIGTRGWVVISQDYKFHLEAFEQLAVKQHKLKCFYLPDTGAKTWITMCVLVRSHTKMLEICNAESAPFIYDIKSNGRLVKVPI